MATGAQLQKSGTEGIAGASAAERLSVLWTRLRVRWAELEPRSRNWAVVSGAILTGLTAFLLWYGLRPDWRILYADLDAEDARQMSEVLTQAQIPFDVAPSGGVIRVPAAQLDKARLSTAARGGLKSGRLGFELFDKPNWVGSEFDEQVNYQRALEGELEHTVGSLEDVASARVHLVMPHDSLFRDQERPAKASVVLRLRHRTLADGEPEAIRNLVASAVDGLTPDRVVLVDAAGHLPLGPRTAEAERLTEEQALEEKLVATLEPVTGPGNVRASVTLDYVNASTEATEESYDPDQTATLSMQRTEQSTGPQPVAAGVPGTATNAPNSQAVPVYPAQTSAPQTAKSESGTYGVSKTVRHTTENPGRVRRLTAAIVVNDRQIAAAGKNKTVSWQPRTADELRHLTAVAQAAVGFDAARGDMLTVEDLSFDDNRPPPALSPVSHALESAERFPVLVKYAALLAGLLAILVLGLRPVLRRLTAPAPPPKTAAKELPGGAAEPPPVPLELEAAETVRTRSQEILDEVAGQLKREPEHTSRLLQSWIHSE